MTEKELLTFEEEFKKLVMKHVRYPDMVSLVIRMEDGHMAYIGNDCIVCVMDSIQLALDAGIVKHKDEIHRDVEYDENDNEIIKH